MLTGRFQLAAPGDEAARPRPRSSSGSGRARAARSTRRAWTTGADVAARRRRDARGPLSRPDPDGQGLPPPGRRRPAGRRASATPSRAPTPTIPTLTLEVWRDADPPPPGRAQEPAPQPGVRGRDRQRLQRRDPARRAAAARSGSGRAWRPRRSTRCTRRRGRRSRTRSRSCASACRRRSRRRSATSSRSTTRAGRPCPRCGTRITEVTRGRVRHVVLPGLPALTGGASAAPGRRGRWTGADQGILRTWPSSGSTYRDVVELGDAP